MAVDVVNEIVIERPVGEVAAYAADPSHAPEWYAKISSVEWLTPPPLAAGTRLAFVARFLGRTLEYTYEVVDYEIDDHLIMRTAQGPFPMETTYTSASTGDNRTTMTLRTRGEPSGFSRFVTPLMSPAVRRATRHDLSKLKSILESRR